MQRLIDKLTVEMKNAAKMLEFEHAAYLRDKIKELQKQKGTECDNGTDKIIIKGARAQQPEKYRP